MSLPTKVRTTHTWLKPFYDWLEGKHPSTDQLQLGSSTGIIGLYGATGAARVATGGNGILSATYLGLSGFASTGIGASGLYTHLARFADNGGSGTPYTFSDVVRQLKNMGALPG